MSHQSVGVVASTLRMAHYRARPARGASERHCRTRYSGELSCHMTLKPIRTFNVVPTLPPALEGLRELAYNLRWCWNHNAVELFQRLDPEGWQTTHHNPVQLLGTVEQARLNAAAIDEGFLAHLRLVLDEFDALSQRQSQLVRRHARQRRRAAGGLLFGGVRADRVPVDLRRAASGVLAGDHLKSASDLGVPLVASGCCTSRATSGSTLNAAGWQQEPTTTTISTTCR